MGETVEINGHSPATAQQRAPAGATGSERAPALHFGGTWEYAPAPETVKVDILPRYELFIGGGWEKPQGEKGAAQKASRDRGIKASSGERKGKRERGEEGFGGGYFATVNPATEEVLSEVALAGAADVDRAVRAARSALPKWAGLPAKERGKYLYRIARRIQERARELAVLETLDGGKPIKESRDVDVPLVAQHFFYHAGWAEKIEWVYPGARPVGVCAQIIPWNFPLLMAAWKIAPALACGNTVVLKPAETTPLTALRLAEILEEIGLPPGVVNIITGDGRTGAALANHPDIDKIAFTGSTEVGKKLARAAAAHPKLPKLTLELGGKSANIIFEDASIDQAVEGIIQAIFFNQGHVCCAGSRLLVQEGVVSAVIEKLKLRMASLRVGDPMDKNTDVGAINSKMQLEKIGEYLECGVAEGAELWVGGAGANGMNGSAVARSRAGLPSRGYWCRPCVFTGVQQSHRVAREEIFGPVLTLQTFRTPEEAVQRANNTPYGLSAGIWTDKGSKMFEIAARLKAGVVWCNTFNRFDAASPFGGYKESGFGREGGMQGLAGYLKM